MYVPAVNQAMCPERAAANVMAGLRWPPLWRAKQATAWNRCSRTVDETSRCSERNRGMLLGNVEYQAAVHCLEYTPPVNARIAVLIGTHVWHPLAH